MKPVTIADLKAALSSLPDDALVSLSMQIEGESVAAFCSLAQTVGGQLALYADARPAASTVAP